MVTKAFIESKRSGWAPSPLAFSALAQAYAPHLDKVAQIVHTALRTLEAESLLDPSKQTFTKHPDLHLFINSLLLVYLHLHNAPEKLSRWYTKLSSLESINSVFESLSIPALVALLQASAALASTQGIDKVHFVLSKRSSEWEKEGYGNVEVDFI